MEAQPIVDIIKSNCPDLKDTIVEGISTIIDSHVNDKHANDNTVAMSLYILSRLATTNPELKFSNEKSEISRSNDIQFLIDFDMDEYALIGDPFKMIENGLINECINMIENDIKLTGKNTLTSQALIYDIKEVKEPRHSYVVKLKYGLQ